MKKKFKLVRSLLYLVLALLLFSYFLYSGYYFIIQRDIIFPYEKIEYSTQVQLSDSTSAKIWLNTNHGSVESWYLSPTEKYDLVKHPLLIVGHGNKQVIDLWLERVTALREMGCAVLLVEYPGYGRSEGSPSQKSIVDTFITAHDSIINQKQNIDKEKIVFFGFSLGGGAVCALSKHRKPAAIILQSTFKSVRNLAKKYFVPTFLVRDPFDNLLALRNYDGPVLIVHCTEDDAVPYTHALALQTAAVNGTLITLSGGHSQCISDWDSFWENDVGTFFKENEILN